MKSVSPYFFYVSNYVYKVTVDLDRKISSSSSSSMKEILEATLSEDKATNTLSEDKATNTVLTKPCNDD